MACRREGEVKGEVIAVLTKLSTCLRLDHLRN
jgi:hypothetical protein